MAGIKNKSMRDIPIMSPMERFQTRGLLGLLAGPSPQEEAIAQAYSQFRQGLQPTTVNAGPLLDTGASPTQNALNTIMGGRSSGYVPLEQGQQQAGQADYAGLLNHLLASGPQGLEQAKILGSMLGMGKSQGSQAKPQQVKAIGRVENGQFIPDPHGYNVTLGVMPDQSVAYAYEAAPKPIPDSALKRLQQGVDTLSQVDNISSTFRPEYAGYKSKLLGDASIAYKKRFGEGGAPGMIQFWQSYQDWVNSVRRQLFGTALTRSEKGEFMKAMINTSMDPSLIQENLSRQQAIIKRAMARNAKSYSSKRFDQDQLSGVLGAYGGDLLNYQPTKLKTGLAHRKPQTQKPVQSDAAYEELKRKAGL